MSRRAVEDEGRVSTEASKGLDPLWNKNRGKDDQRACLEVGHDKADGENGLSEAHFVTDETAAFGR